MCVDIAVVICSYTRERWDDVVAAIASVRQQTLPAREIVLVVDHHPTMLQQAQQAFADICVVENQGPAGANGSRNAGVAATSSPIIAFLDDDAVARPDWLAQLAASFTNPQVL